MNPEQERQRLQDLLDQLLRATERVLASGEVLSDDFLGLLAEQIEGLNDRITRLDEQINRVQTTEPPPEQPRAEPLGAPPTPSQQLMWILAGQNEDAFVNYLRSYPDPELRTLLQNPGELRRVIEYLNQMMPNLPQPSEDGIEHAPLNSSNIYGFRYDPKSGRLLVRFQGGSVYGYNGVPPGVFRVFQQGAVPARTTGQNRWGRWWQGKVPSLGAAFYQMIRQGGYPYERLS